MRDYIGISLYRGHRCRRASLLLATALATLSGPVLAQSGGSGSPGEQEAQAPAVADQDIIVTARRTSERLQDVPVAVTAFGNRDLVERRISTESDLQSVTPGLTVRQNTSSNQLGLSIRGQAVDAFSYSAPAVLAYFNETQAGGVTSTAFFDLESIQVLKGPQGTLFGRNATGGAVLYKTRSPSKDFEGYLRAGYGNYDNREVEGAINVPLGSFGALRVSGKMQKRDGFQHNLYNGDRLNSIDSRNIRGSLLISPDGSGFENTTVFQYGKYGGNSGGVKVQNAYAVGQTNNGYALNATAAALYGPGFINLTTDPRVRQLGFDGIADYISKQKNIGFYDFYNDADGRHRARQYIVTNTTTYEVSDAVNFKNIIGYNNVVSRDKSDADGSPFQMVTAGVNDPTPWNYTYQTEQFSNEFQVNGKLLDNRLTYIFGLFVSRETNGQIARYNVGGDYPGGTASPPGLFLYNFETKDTSKAVFLQATYALTDRLNFTAGGRYTWEKISIHQRPGDLYGSLGVGPRSSKFSKPSWTVGLDYKVTDDLLLYFNHRGSWRTGGFNGTSTDLVGGVLVPNQFKPETTYDFEIGAKLAGNLGPIPARLNIALYDQYVKNVQRTVYIDITAVSGNVNKARVTGAEIDGSFDLTPWLQVGGAFTYTHARYTDPQAVVAGVSLPFGPYADSPKYSGSAFFRAKADLANDAGEVALRGDLYAQSSTYYTNLADTLTPDTKLPGYGILNGRLEWNRILGSDVSAAAYIRNITDKHYYAGGLGVGAVIGVNGTLTGTPRTYGFELSVNF